MSDPASDPAARGPRLRGWPVWSLPTPLLAYVVGVCAFTVGVAAVAAAVNDWHRTDALVALVLVAGGVVCIEISRELGEPAGINRDLLASWQVSAALLLPPIYALLVPVPLVVWAQVRGQRTLLHRRVFSIAVIGVTCAGASALFHLTAAPGVVASRTAWVDQPLETLAAAVVCGAAAVLVNSAMVSVAVRLASPHATWSEVMWDREDAALDLLESCLGVIVAALVSITLVFAIVVLPPLLMLQRSLLHRQLTAAARTDAKTGLLNAGAWQREAERELARSDRSGEPLAMLLLDLDHFKRINDCYGHLAGDEALMRVADGLRDAVREYDVVGRFGGEEFVILLPHTDQAEALAVAERIRAGIAGISIDALATSRRTAMAPRASFGQDGALAIDLRDLPRNSGDLEPEAEARAQLTTSVGVSFRTGSEDLTDLLTGADLALFRAKAQGRDRVAW